MLAKNQCMKGNVAFGAWSKISDENSAELEIKSPTFNRFYMSNCHLAAASVTFQQNTLQILNGSCTYSFFFWNVLFYFHNAKQPQLIGDSVLEVSVHGHLS